MSEWGPFEEEASEYCSHAVVEKKKMDTDFAGPNSVRVAFDLYKLGQVASLSRPQFRPASEGGARSASDVAVRIEKAPAESTRWSP